MKQAKLIFLFAGLFFFYQSQAQFMRMRPRYRQPVRRGYQDPSFKPALSLSFGYGYPNLDKYSLLDFYGAYRGSASQKGPVFGSLDYRVNRTTSIGAMVSYGEVKAPYYNYNSATPTQPDFTGQLTNWSAMLNMVRYMPGSASVSPYLRTAFGVNIWDQNYTDKSGNKVVANLPEAPVFAYQAALGVKFHFTQHSGAFLEAGYGKYIVSAGLTFKLN